MSATTSWTFSGRRTRANAVPVAEQKVRRHSVHRSRCSPVRVSPQRCRAVAPQWTHRSSACPRASMREQLDPRVELAQPPPQLPHLPHRQPLDAGAQTPEPRAIHSDPSLRDDVR
jgi:hypothetical protein